MGNTYNILGNQVPIKGASLEIALEKAGYTNIKIVPLWDGISDGSYKVYCSEKTILLVHWVEKRAKLNLPCHNTNKQEEIENFWENRRQAKELAQMDNQSMIGLDCHESY